MSGIGTNFTGLAIAPAYNCGIRNFDVKLAYEAALKNELVPKNRLAGAGKLDVGEFVKRGYCPYLGSLGYDTNTQGSGFGASHTLEYSYSAYCCSSICKIIK